MPVIMPLARPVASLQQLQRLSHASARQQNRRIFNAVRVKLPNSSYQSASWATYSYMSTSYECCSCCSLEDVPAMEQLDAGEVHGHMLEQFAFILNILKKFFQLTQVTSYRELTCLTTYPIGNAQELTISSLQCCRDHDDSFCAAIKPRK